VDEQEFIDRFGMTREEYGQRFGVLEDPNQGKGATLREKTVDATANFLQGLGSDQYTAYKRARDLFGNPNADLSESIGVMDFTPLQLPFAIQEGKRALQRGDTAEGLFDLGFAGVEMFPAARLATTPIKGFFSSLASKLSKSTDNLGALPTDESRRTFMAGAVATPIVAGTLGDLPVSKMIDDVAPVVKKVGKALPKDFSLASTKFFKKAIKNIKSETKDSYRDSPAIGEMIINEMDESSPQELLDSAFSTGYFDATDAIRDLKKKYPGATDDEIYNLFPESAEITKEFVQMIDPEFSFVQFPKGGFNKKDKYGEKIKTKEEAIEKLDSLRKQYPDVEFVSFYETSDMFPELNGHRIYYKKSNDDLVTPSNREKKFNNEPADFTLSDVPTLSEKAPI
jgi:hypothetical protein